MRLNLLPTIFLSILFCSCSESNDPNVSVVETLEVTQSHSSNRKFNGNLEHLVEGDTIIAYGFEWESRYGSWQTRRAGHLNKGKFTVNDTTRLSKWNSFTVRAFIETTSGVTHGNDVTFETQGK